MIFEFMNNSVKKSINRLTNITLVARPSTQVEVGTVNTTSRCLTS